MINLPFYLFFFLLIENIRKGVNNNINDGIILNRERIKFRVKKKKKKKLGEQELGGARFRNMLLWLRIYVMVIMRTNHAVRDEFCRGRLLSLSLSISSSYHTGPLLNWEGK